MAGTARGPYQRKTIRSAEQVGIGAVCPGEGIQTVTAFKLRRITERCGGQGGGWHDKNVEMSAIADETQRRDIVIAPFHDTRIAYAHFVQTWRQREIRGAIV